MMDKEKQKWHLLVIYSNFSRNSLDCSTAGSKSDELKLANSLSSAVFRLLHDDDGDGGGDDGEDYGDSELRRKRVHPPWL